MSQSLRERHRQMVRDEILDSAQTLVAQKGYAAVSMDELAAQAGISKPTLYSYFTTKEELVVESILRDMRRLLATFEEAGQQGQSPLEHLELLLKTIVELQIRDQTMGLHPWAPELMHMVRHNEEACDYIRRMRVVAGRLIQAGMDCGEIDASLNVPTVIRVLYSMAMSLKFGHEETSEPFDPQHVVQSILTMFRRAVQPDR